MNRETVKCFLINYVRVSFTHPAYVYALQELGSVNPLAAHDSHIRLALATAQ